MSETCIIDTDVKKLNILTEKIGLSQKKAEWVLKRTTKHHIWLANQVKSLNCYRDYLTDIIMIFNWLKLDNTINIKDLSLPEATKLAKTALDNKYGFIITDKSLKNKDVVLDLGDYKWVKLNTVSDCYEEGNAMSNCLNTDRAFSVSSGKKNVYSLRDRYNRPHVTLDITNRLNIGNLYGGGNSTVTNKDYITAIVNFLEFEKTWKTIHIKYDTERAHPTIRTILGSCVNQNKFELAHRIWSDLNKIGKIEMGPELENSINSINTLDF